MPAPVTTARLSVTAEGRSRVRVAVSEGFPFVTLAVLLDGGDLSLRFSPTEAAELRRALDDALGQVPAWEFAATG